MEVFARLDVRSVENTRRLLWNDVVSLAREYSELTAAIQASPGSSEDAPRESKSGGSGSPSAVANDPAAETPDDAQGFDPRQAKLRAYVENSKGDGTSLDLKDDAWIERVLNDPEAELDRLSTKIQRRHNKRLRDLLGIGSTGGEAQRSLASPTDFTNEPDLQAEHTPRHDVDSVGTNPEELELAWPQPEHGFAWFRVIAGYSGRRPVLFDGRQVASTAESTTKDAEPLRDGRRQYDVWAYLGADQREAMAARPVLWARGTALQPVQNVKVSVSGDDISGTWTAGDGTSQVEVYRFAGDEARASHEIVDDRRIASDKDNLSGFEDRDLQAGDYVYRFFACAVVAGRKLRSTPVTVRQSVVIPVPPVQKLEVVADPERPGFIVSWAHPSGSDVNVQIHLTKDELPTGIGTRELDESSLERVGFSDSTRLTVPPQLRSDGRWMIRVDWPDDADRVHFTAISSIGTSYRVGATGTEVRVRALDSDSIRVVERVDEQYLVFPWPSGADSVQVSMRPSGALDPDPKTWPKVTRFTRERHETHGGIHLEPLPSEGCRLAVFGLAYYGGEVTTSEPQFVEYPGLTRIRYDFVQEFEMKGFLRKKESPAGTTLWVEATGEVAESVVLVRNHNRLPLHVADGDHIFEGQLETRGGKSILRREGFSRGTDRAGFVRLFVAVPDDEQHLYAVLDPSIDSLQWS
ncbi:hypothetical protein ncot_11805 [Nocardioides sp. JQ2195]|uniref:hypothetical protein n=1 Tax=Nocardioides sp. JQ2195 TaxID=2592334 RepID=UPI00143E13C1|nr:hypothetical protein [Nocardioides sp. JQ2195]QIX27207.1 hypothetical protein ncot_11805 [Nocardioides sp. JQ2195]